MFEFSNVCWLTKVLVRFASSLWKRQILSCLSFRKSNTKSLSVAQWKNVLLGYEEVIGSVLSPFLKP